MPDKEEIFNSIIRDNDERIHRICKYYNSNEEDRKDMYQEILVNIWKSMDGFKGDALWSTWVYRVAINTSLNYTGKSYRKMKLMVDNGVETISKLVAENEIAVKKLEEKQYDSLQTALNRLSVIDKALISLSLEDLSMKEIAEIIGITESNVRVKIHRIKTQLKNELNHADDEDK